MASLMDQQVKNPSANAGDIRDVGLTPGSGRSSGGGNGNPLQYSCLKNPMDRRTWRATVQRVTKESDMTEQLHTTDTHRELLKLQIPGPTSRDFNEFKLGP